MRVSFAGLSVAEVACWTHLLLDVLSSLICFDLEEESSALGCSGDSNGTVCNLRRGSVWESHDNTKISRKIIRRWDLIISIVFFLGERLLSQVLLLFYYELCIHLCEIYEKVGVNRSSSVDDCQMLDLLLSL
jgi:hypothetical protein